MSANSDIKLQPGQVVVDAWDLCLDSPDRRKNESEYRRALVHDFSDGLTVNWDRDYPGGVTVEGLKEANGHEEGAKVTNLREVVFYKSGPSRGRLALGRACLVRGDSLLYEDLKYLQFSAPVRIKGEVTFVDEVKHEGGQVFAGQATFAGPATFAGGATVEGPVALNQVNNLGDVRLRLRPDDKILIELHGRLPQLDAEPKETIDLVAELKSLRAQIAALEKKVANLEQGVS